MAPSTGPTYAKDERILCFHMELLYEAKVLDSKPKDPNDKKEGFLYKVHYKGWKNTWDDWVPGERCRKWTEENKELAANLKKDMESHRKASVKSAQASAKKRAQGSDIASRGSEERSSVAPPPRGQKRGRDIEGIEKEEDFLRKSKIKFHMPDQLKTSLVDDWEKITKDHKIVPLPTTPCITQFLNEYETAEMANRSAGSAEADLLEEFLAGIKEYFNKALGRILLYRWERSQFYNVHRQLERGNGDWAGKSYCDVYGCEHLLRLLVSLPDLIAHTNMDSQAVNRMREETTLMTSWLGHRMSKYLATEYELPSGDYVEGNKMVV